MTGLVFARPERLQRFRETAHGMADGLELRRRALGDAVDRYRARTEAAYESGCANADDAVHALALTVRQLGVWVGAVGDAFELLDGVTVMDGVYQDPFGMLGDALPPELQVDGAGRPVGSDADGGGFGVDVLDGLTLASAAGAGLGRPEMRAVAAVVGRDRALGRTAGAVADSPRTPRLAHYLDATAAVRAAGGEFAHRWNAEPDRATAERAARAAVDGLLTGAGTYGGAWGGAAVGGAICAPSLVAVPMCASAGSFAGGWLGARAGEWVSDRILGDEPESWERDPDQVTDQVGEVDDAVVDGLTPVIDDLADDAAEAAARHADFVLDHPWLWDDDHLDAPHHAPPQPAPVLPTSGPR